MSNEQTLVTREELLTLPRWACVAFAARCARRVQPLFDLFWPDAPEKHRAAVERAISIGERSAANAAADAAAYAAKAAKAADDAVIYAVNAATFYAAYAADAAAYAAKAADAAAEAAAEAAAKAADAAAYAAKAADAAAEVLAAMRTDFDRLAAAAKEQDWNNDTPVPPEFFGPIWPDGEPEGWLTKAPTTNEPVPIALPSDAASLSLCFDLDEFSAAEVADFINDLSEVYGELGGDRLIIEETLTFEPAPAPEPVS